MIFKEIDKLNTIITNISNAGNSIDKIAKITNGLTSAESTLVMTEAGLNDVLIAKVNAINGVTTATIANTTATQAETLSDEDWLLAQWLCIGAEETDTVATVTNTAAKKSGLTIVDALGLKYKNLAASIGISTTALTAFTVALVAIGAGIAVFNHFNETAEEVSEKVTKLKDEFQSALDTAESNIKTLDSVKDRYVELSKGVNQLGENISLTTEEYQEYNSIVNKIADMSPELIQGWTNEGNAIINLKGNIDDLTASYDEARIAAYNLLIASGENGDGNDIIQQWKNLSEDDLLNKDVFGANAFNETAKRDLAKLVSENNNVVDDFINSLNKFIEQNKFASNEVTDFLRGEVGITIGSYDKISGFKSSLNGEELTSEELANIKSKANAIAKTYQAEINSALNDVKSLANAYLMTDDVYDNLSSKNKNIASMLVNGINEETAKQFESQEDVSIFVSNILTMIQEATPEVNNALVKLFELNNEDLPISEIKPLIDNYIAIMAEALGENPMELKIRLGFESYDKLYDNYQQILHDVAKKASGATDNEIINSRGKYTEYQQIYDKIDAFAIEYSINTQDEIAAFQDALDKAKSDIDKAFEYYLSQIEEGEQSHIPTIVDSVQQIATQLEPQFAKLGEAYKNIFTSDGFTLENIDNSMLEDLRTTFTEIGEEIGVTFDSEQLEPFFDSLTNGTATSEQVQQAFNDLATSYFYSTDTLDKLNDTTAEAIKKQLEELGVANAKDVVYETLKIKTEALAVQEEILATKHVDVTKAAYDEVEGLLAEAGASETARKYLFYLVAQEQIFSETKLSVSDKIEKLKELASAYGQTAIVAKIAQREMLLAIDPTDTSVPSSDDFLNELETEINNSVNRIELDLSGIDTNAGKAGKEAGEEYKEALEKELSDLDTVLNFITDTIQDQIDLWNDQKDAAVDALEAERDAAIEALEAQKEALQEQIDAKQKIIDKIKEAREERQAEIDLQKKQYDLERLQNQSTQLVKLCQTL